MSTTTFDQPLPPDPSNPWLKAPKKRSHIGLIALGIMVTFWLGLIVVVGAVTNRDKPVPAPSVAATSVRSPAATSQPPVQASLPPVAGPVVPLVIKDGTWTVGKDFPAGTYRTTDADPTCYWEIDVSGTNGMQPVANHFGGGHLEVKLSVGQDFETDRCGTWHKE